LAEELAKANMKIAEVEDITEHLKERTDTLVGALLSEKARNAATPGRLPVDYGNVGDTDAITITGRHRLHTSMIPTTNQTPTQDDDFE
jgi:hypothetical protein